MARAKHGVGQKGAAYHLLERLGGIRAVAEDFKVPYARVLKWSTIGPPRYEWHSLQQLAIRRGIRITDRMLEQAYREGRKRLPAHKNGASE